MQYQIRALLFLRPIRRAKVYFVKTSRRVSVCGVLLALLLVWREESASAQTQPNPAANSTATNQQPATSSTETAPVWTVPSQEKVQKESNRIEVNAALSHSTYSQ